MGLTSDSGVKFNYLRTVMKSIALLFLMLLASGCSSLRPPAQDKLAWEWQQSEGQKMSPGEEGAWNLLYYVAEGASSFVH